MFRKIIDSSRPGEPSRDFSSDNKTTKLGIAFGGGGMRGFVHLGVIQDLRKQRSGRDCTNLSGAIAAVL